jgi:hypothetical protein
LDYQYENLNMYLKYFILPSKKVFRTSQPYQPYSAAQVAS